MNKKVIIGVVLLILIILVVIGAAAFKSLTKPQIAEEVPTPTVVLPTVSEKIKVDLTAKNDNKTVDLKISGVSSDIDTIEYELTYMTGAGLPRGVLGKITVDGKSTVSRNDVDLGTCSRGRCVYDTGVTEVSLSLKFNSSSGSSSIFQKTYPL